MNYPPTHKLFHAPPPFPRVMISVIKIASFGQYKEGCHSLSIQTHVFEESERLTYVHALLMVIVMMMMMVVMMILMMMMMQLFEEPPPPRN